MAGIARGRHTADVNGGVTVLLIGMRINNPLAFHRWIPVTRAMFSMLNDLKRNPAKGLRGVHMFTTGRTFVFVQYWESAEALQRYARDPGDLHRPAWRAFYRGDTGAVGIFHETYDVPPGHAECIYGNMPVFGLAAATRHVPVSQRGQSAAYRMGRTSQDDPAEPVPTP
jgi:hypothetical protein